MSYRPRRPIEDGAYVWHAAFWNGAVWVEAPRGSRLRVDTIAPGPVEGLRVELDAERGETRLSWDPVVFDERGQPEYVARYHVLRYTTGRPWPVARAYQVAATPDPRWTDGGGGQAGLVVYRVIAEDEAGNVGSGRR
jgi:hypothetical protein